MILILCGKIEIAMQVIFKYSATIFINQLFQDIMMLPYNTRDLFVLTDFMLNIFKLEFLAKKFIDTHFHSKIEELKIY